MVSFDIIYSKETIFQYESRIVLEERLESSFLDIICKRKYYRINYVSNAEVSQKVSVIFIVVSFVGIVQKQSYITPPTTFKNLLPLNPTANQVLIGK